MIRGARFVLPVIVPRPFSTADDKVRATVVPTIPIALTVYGCSF